VTSLTRVRRLTPAMPRMPMLVALEPTPDRGDGDQPQREQLQPCWGGQTLARTAPNGCGLECRGEHSGARRPPATPHQRRRHADEPDGDRLFSPLYIALFLEGEQLSNGSADSRNAAPLGLQTKTTTTNLSNSGSWGLSGVRGSAPRRIFGCFAMVLSIV